MSNKYVEIAKQYRPAVINYCLRNILGIAGLVVGIIHINNKCQSGRFNLSLILICLGIFNIVMTCVDFYHIYRGIANDTSRVNLCWSIIDTILICVFAILLSIILFNKNINCSEIDKLYLIAFVNYIYLLFSLALFVVLCCYKTYTYSNSRHEVHYKPTPRIYNWEWGNV